MTTQDQTELGLDYPEVDDKHLPQSLWYAEKLGKNYPARNTKLCTIVNQLKQRGKAWGSSPLWKF